MSRSKLFLVVFMAVFVIYEELLFHIVVFKKISLDFLYVLFFSITVGLMVYVVSNLFKNKLNRIPTYLFLSLITLLFIVNLIYYRCFGSFVSVYSIFHGGQTLEFKNQIFNIIIDNWLSLVLMLLPLILYIVLDVLKKIDYNRTSALNKMIMVVIAVLIHVALIISINTNKSTAIYSNKNLYNNIHSMLLISERFGNLTAFRLDVTRSVFGFREKDIDIPVIDDFTPIIPDGKEEKEVTYNVLDIDFDELIKNESNSVIKDIHTYISKQSFSNQNDYTGMFKDKNLVVFVAEAFAPMAIDPVLHPTLYRLYNEGFQFDNFYTPLFPVSTGDGEYITDTSLVPKEGVWSLYAIRDNYMPYSYANVFKNLGYSNNSYHNNTYTYYNRHLYLKAMGYDSYRACGNGLNIRCKIWPQSDLEMLGDTVEDYINNDKFLAYYMTVSGHFEYTRLGNMMVTKNWGFVKDLPYSEKAKGYLAANIELDRAVEHLIKELEIKGKLEDTVIVISADHYPYGLSLNEINEISSYERDADFEVHHMPFLVWNSEMEKPIKVEKYGSSLDVLPTILNLFGVSYDSRLLMGRDILSESTPLVIFSNRSFITDQCRYNSISKSVTKINEDSLCDNTYIEGVSGVIYNKYKYSRLIIENDYYRVLYKKLGWLKN